MFKNLDFEGYTETVIFASLRNGSYSFKRQQFQKTTYKGMIY